jgi:hypothetical protein
MTTIVSYDSFAKALTGAASRTAFEARNGEPTDAELRANLAEALEELRLAETLPGVLAAPSHQLSALMQSYLAEHPGEIGTLERPGPAGALEVMYDSGDILGWFRSLFSWWRRIKPEPWREAPDAPLALDKPAMRLALLGDWGTGLYGAPVSARSIENTPDPYDLIFHLGDVYYSGTESEVRDNFLAYWPKVPGAVSRAANSNHEMYSGGAGLFRQTLPAFGQEATNFAVQNRYWLLAGLDTGYDEHDLHGDQVGWLERLVEQAGDRRLILFSHHQPFSMWDGQGPRLVTKLSRFLDGRRVFAWYWGHEHRCILYDRHPAWHMFGRCVGHGGFPAFRDPVEQLPVEGDPRWRRLAARSLIPGGIMLDAPNPYLARHEQKYNAHGYLSLIFDGPRLRETVHLPDGTPILDREIA